VQVGQGGVFQRIYFSTVSTKPDAPAGRPTVFLSYSHKDGTWLQELRAMLAPLVGNKVVDVWWDGEIRPSREWRQEIDRALETARIGVLLVTPHFLASDFIASKELPYLLEAARHRKAELFWILWSSCLHQKTPLAEIQAAHDVSKPLDTLRRPQRRAVLSQICQRIADAVEAGKAAEGGAGIEPGVSTPGSRSPQISPSPEGAQAGARGGNPAGVGGGMPASLRDSGNRGDRGDQGDQGRRVPGVETPGYMPASLRDSQPRLDLGRLPIAGPYLIGRETELARLDAAWEDPNTRILTLVAFGGTGKSALVGRWLQNLSLDGYRGARRVLDWSFYSQGSEQDRATSADRFLDHALTWFGDSDPKAGAPRDRGLRLADLVRQEKTLLVLDGVYSLRGYQYCDLLLSRGEPEAWKEVRERSKYALKIVLSGSRNLLDVALNHLSLGRAHLDLGAFSKATEHLDQAVEGLRQSGNEDDLPRGLLARGDLRRLQKDWPGAEADLSEALEIAERGLMRLHECDAHLEWARLCEDRGDREGAERHRTKARKLVEETGYGRRRGEVEALEPSPPAPLPAARPDPRERGEG
jgi:tetratricopeptide (TPR) repeat protein